MKEKNGPLSFHLSELRKRLINSVIIYFLFAIISYFYAENIYDFLVSPLSKAGTTYKMIYTDITEAFFTYLKLSLFAGFIFAFPLIAYQLYKFIAPGLYDYEKLLCRALFILMPMLFLSGAILVYYGIFPLAWKFFLSFETNLPISNIDIQLEAKISEYLSLVIHLILAFGLSFQLPILLTLLVQMQLISIDWLKKKRRIAIVVIFAIAAIITPPDVISQIALALPLIMLYEFSIIASKFIEKKGKKNA